MALSKELQVVYNKLTDKQQRFVDLWTGDATETATLAGYAVPKQTATKLLKNGDICLLIKTARDIELAPKIFSRKQRQKFWTKVIKGEITTTMITKAGVEVEVPPKLQDRLKASDLLGKSEGDFLDRVSITDDRPDIPAISETLTEKDLRDLCRHAMG